MANEDKAARYHRLRRRASLLGTAGAAVLLMVFVVSGASAWLRALVDAVVGDSLVVGVVVYVACVIAAWEVLDWPRAFYQGVILERRYGLSRESTARWWREHAKGVAVGVFMSAIGAVAVMSLLRWNPARWWVAAALGFTVLLVLLAHLAPVLLLPIFYECRPLARAELAERLIALSRRAGARVLGVFEWRVGERTRKANAALAGIGRTRRILLSDTLLAEHSDEEIEVILAHELAHHVHRDMWATIALEAWLLVLGFACADGLLSVFGQSFGLLGKTDVAALPLIALGVGAMSLALRPLSNAFSRHHERRADRYALEMTGNAAAFVSAMKRLAAQNLAEEQPSRLVEFLFYTHPPTSARLEAARRYTGREAIR